MTLGSIFTGEKALNLARRLKLDIKIYVVLRHQRKKILGYDNGVPNTFKSAAKGLKPLISWYQRQDNSNESHNTSPH